MLYVLAMTYANPLENLCMLVNLVHNSYGINLGLVRHHQKTAIRKILL